LIYSIHDKTYMNYSNLSYFFAVSSSTVIFEAFWRSLSFFLSLTIILNKTFKISLITMEYEISPGNIVVENVFDDSEMFSKIGWKS